MYFSANSSFNLFRMYNWHLALNEKKSMEIHLSLHVKLCLPIDRCSNEKAYE